MSGPEAPSHNKRLPSDMENGQRGLDAEQMQQQQLKLRERQRFFEEVFQHDVDFFFPVSHLQIEHRRPPLGSISSMEVNVDMLEQMDMMDLSDQDTVDVFLSCGTEDNNNVTPLLPDSNLYQDEISLQVPNTAEIKSRISSTSSASTDLNSLDTSEEGAETPVVQSDEEELQQDGPDEQETKS
ncbi:dysbindin domain-containing protein 2 [Varanus komodoensis]|uniref:dysbindin domain-containing protein 2 n=1 Tax=Varanus komodoensis TaxID=61221 RepID=UPI001CF7E065|nr:dysbindin domain-containing protein 2 [Varanus komodoensis]